MALLGIAGAVASFAWRSEHSAALAPHAPTADQVDRVTSLRSRFAADDQLEVWGATDAPDGASVAVEVRSAGGPPVALPATPVDAGHFLVRAPLPASLRGLPVAVRARVAG